MSGIGGGYPGGGGDGVERKRYSSVSSTSREPMAALSIEATLSIERYDSLFSGAILWIMDVVATFLASIVLSLKRVVNL
jgi:hypothetical protein